MALSAYVDHLDDVLEVLHGHYVAMEDGRFRLDIAGVEDVAGLEIGS